ncbi:Predicted pyrophosphatase or phosphodiesterase, AlkP superfamily [Filimonas lacunae]|uniref:Predicted pyrophosphatase or phosphodiesterase, AlkP superfamily n=1 Tax=Filimonas lacunae TaxID=477680 RepID=A0A173M9Z5_9BACT|nr:ectonucleotide pyrophosphatase/phosphodiesterase [Filimonas lacunae]BAV04364.1 AP superfamily protein [Filimonas lacunae]SIT31152.1 Predicted pyrophosphatase or phosphodiesterase, AlkP superfamily [Filimonas lacunae]
MKKNVLTALALLLGCGAFAQSRIKHVVLITVDGFRPDFYQQAKWEAPNLKQLVKEGVQANGVNSVFPSMTYPSHTAIVTGVQPITHGIYYNDRFDPTGKGSVGNYWQDSSIHVPTLWSVLHGKGMKVASLYWPVSAGAPVDYNIPDIGGRGVAVRDENSIPVNFAQEMHQTLAGKGHSGDVHTADIAAYLIEKEAPALITMHLFAVDHAEHVTGREGEMVHEAIAEADEAVGIVKAALQKKGIWDSTLLIVTGDHGFVDVHTTFNPNNCLQQAGLLNNREKGDWKAQFNYSGGSAWLYLKDANDKASLAAATKALKALPDSVQRYFRIIDRKQLDKIGANPQVVLALTAENNAAFGGKPEEPAVASGKGGTHGYFPDFHNIQTGFIAVGSGIKKGATVQEFNLRDIAPIVAKALGISFPTAQGKVPAGIFE